MFRALVYKDAVLLRLRRRSFVMFALAGVVMLVLIATAGRTMGGQMLGVDFVRLFLLSLPGIGIFLEHYTGSLAADKRDGVLALVMLNGGKRLSYFAAKAILPLGVGLGASVLMICAYLIGVSGTGFSVTALAHFLAVLGPEVFLVMGAGMLLNVLTDVDIGSNPNIVYPLILLNAPLLYFANPVSHLPLFVALTLAAGAGAYWACWIVIGRWYQSNLCGECP